MDIKETNWNYVDWIHVAQHRDQWQAFVGAVMKLRAS
jgi:hypothetical protein